MDGEPMEMRTGVRYKHMIRYTSPLLYAHVDPTTALTRAEAPVQIGWHALLPALIFTILATVAVTLRWYSRARLTRTVMPEDWLILFAMVLSVAMTGVVGGEVSVASKIVRHRWHKEAGNVSKLAQLVLCSNLLYHVLINATKSSFLLQYLRLFHERWPRRLCKALLCVALGAALYGLFGGIFMCTPVQRYWDPRVPGRCIDAETYWITTAAIGIVMDFFVWMLPMPLLRALCLPRMQKLSLIAVFALGGFVCVVSILRLSLVLAFSAEGKTEEAGISAIVRSTIEANVGIMCASLMVLKPLLAKMFPRLLDTAGPSRGNLRLPTISEDPVGPSVWMQNWTWGSTNDAVCSASRPTSRVLAPQGTNGILVTKKSVVEANWTRDDSVACGSVLKPPRAYSCDDCEV